MRGISGLLLVLILIMVTVAISACQGRSTATIQPTLTPVRLVTQTAVPLPSIPPLVSATQPAPIATAPILKTPTSGVTKTAPSAQGQLPATSGQPLVTVAAENLPNPDDLLVAPDGTLYISVIGDGSIRKLTPGGALETVVTGLSEPEGMIWLPDGSLVIAEQGRNRLVKFDPQTGAVTPFLSLKNPDHQLGVDGIALDAHVPDSPSIIIPDSPNSTLLRSSLDVKNIQTIVSGLVRPTGAWVEPDGSILVVEEFGGTLVRIRTDGTREMFVRDLSEPDDVVEDPSGRIFVNTLVDGAVYVFSNDGKQSQVVISGLHSPQGIALDANGSLFVTDAGQGRLLKIMTR